MAAWRVSRIFLYVLIWIFSVIVIGFTSSRIHYTHVTTSNYEPITAEILSTSILALIWTTYMVIFLGAQAGGVAASYAVENFFNTIIWVLYLVGNAIFSHKFAHIGACRKGEETCRVLTGTMAFAWINWSFITIIIIISIAHMSVVGASPTDPGYSEKRENRERV